MTLAVKQHERNLGVPSSRSSHLACTKVVLEVHLVSCFPEEKACYSSFDWSRAACFSERTEVIFVFTACSKNYLKILTCFFLVSACVMLRKVFFFSFLFFFFLFFCCDTV